METVRIDWKSGLLAVASGILPSGQNQGSAGGFRTFQCARKFNSLIRWAANPPQAPFRFLPKVIGIDWKSLEIIGNGQNRSEIDGYWPWRRASLPDVADGILPPGKNTVLSAAPGNSGVRRPDRARPSRPQVPLRAGCLQPGARKPGPHAPRLAPPLQYVKERPRPRPVTPELGGGGWPPPRSRPCGTTARPSHHRRQKSISNIDTI